MNLMVGPISGEEHKGGWGVPSGDQRRDIYCTR